MSVWSWHQGERRVSTHVQIHEPFVRVGLGVLFEACGLGPERDVPDGGGSGHVVRKRIGEHAVALRKVPGIPYLDLGLTLTFHRLTD